MFPPSSKRLGLVIVLALLLLQLFLRMHHITAQGAYVDEGVHSMRGATVWKLDANPGRESDGKFLLYYYLGLFEAESTTALFASRAAIALFSLISGAAVTCSGGASTATPPGWWRWDCMLSCLSPSSTNGWRWLIPSRRASPAWWRGAAWRSGGVLAGAMG
jgi:hypothetical protein